MTEIAQRPAGIEAVLDILSEVLEVPAERIRAQPELREHGWSSLSSLEALTQLENYFQCKVDLRSFTTVTTYQGVLDALATARA
jgi:acyl carrier protein